MSHTYLDQMALSYLSPNWQPPWLNLLSLFLNLQFLFIFSAKVVLLLFFCSVWFWGGESHHKIRSLLTGSHNSIVFLTQHTSNWGQCATGKAAQALCRALPAQDHTMSPGHPLQGAQQPHCWPATQNSCFRRQEPRCTMLLSTCESSSLKQLQGRDFGFSWPKLWLAMLLEIKWIIKSTKVTQSYQQLNNLRKLHGRNSIIRLPERAAEPGRTVGFDVTFFPCK